MALIEPTGWPLRVRLPVRWEKMASGLAEPYWNPATEGNGGLLSGRITRTKRSRPLPPYRAGSIPLELIFNNLPPVVDGSVHEVAR
jgi:hypothetical protein